MPLNTQRVTSTLPQPWAFTAPPKVAWLAMNVTPRSATIAAAVALIAPPSAPPSRPWSAVLALKRACSIVKLPPPVTNTAPPHAKPA